MAGKTILGRMNEWGRKSIEGGKFKRKINKKNYFMLLIIANIF